VSSDKTEEGCAKKKSGKQAQTPHRHTCDSTESNGRAQQAQKRQRQYMTQHGKKMETEPTSHLKFCTTPRHKTTHRCAAHSLTPHQQTHPARLTTPCRSGIRAPSAPPNPTALRPSTHTNTRPTVPPNILRSRKVAQHIPQRPPHPPQVQWRQRRRRPRHAVRVNDVRATVVGARQREEVRQRRCRRRRSRRRRTGRPPRRRGGQRQPRQRRHAPRGGHRPAGGGGRGRAGARVAADRPPAVVVHGAVGRNGRRAVAVPLHRLHGGRRRGRVPRCGRRGCVPPAATAVAAGWGERPRY